MTEEQITERRSRNRVLWVVLAISAALNAVLSAVNVYLALVFGVIVLGCAIALIARRQGRR